METNIFGLAINKSFRNYIEELQKQLGCVFKAKEEVEFGDSVKDWRRYGYCDIYFTETGTLLFLNKILSMYVFEFEDYDSMAFAHFDSKKLYNLNYWENGKLKRSLLDFKQENQVDEGEEQTFEGDADNAQQVVFKYITHLLGQDYSEIETTEKMCRYLILPKEGTKDLGKFGNPFGEPEPTPRKILLPALQDLFYNAVQEEAVKNGFKIEKSTNGGGIYRNSKILRQSMGWGFSTYGTSFVFNGFYAISYFKDFDLEVTDVLRKHKLFGGKPGERMDSNFHPNFAPAFSFHSNNSNGIDFVSVDEVEYILDIYNDFCCNKAIPYFNEYSNPLKVYEYIKTTDEYEALGLGIYYKFYKALILRKCNDDSCFDYFQLYLADRKKVYDQYKDKDVIHGRYYFAALEFNDLLPNIQPVYNI
ncbi:MAG: hypothetical protein ACKVQB_12230 [Bacteroidia bacterium]